MEHNANMIKNNRVNKVFQDLETFRQFCVDYGYSFNEKDLYNRKSFAYNNYERYQLGKSFTDQWAEDAARLNR